MEESEVDFAVHQRAIRAAFQLLDECELGTVFESRAQMMKTVPFFLSGAQSSCAHVFGRNHVGGGTIAMK